MLQHSDHRSAMTSRERVLAALNRREVDYVPCSPGFNPLNAKTRLGHVYQFPFGPSAEETVQYSAEVLGVDPTVHLYVTQCYPDADVTSRVWIDDSDVIHKVWTTPAGEIRAAIEYNELWPHGLDIPFNSDFNPAHYVTPWLKSAADLACLQHILKPAWSAEHLANLRFQARVARDLARKYRLATAAQIGFGLSGALCLCGPESLCLMTVERPELVDAYLALDHEFNMKCIELAADLGIDILWRNGFYESSDIYSPAMLERFLGRRLNEEFDAIRAAGKASCYTLNTGIMPMLDYVDRLRVDCLFGIDMTFRNTDIRKMKAKLGDSKSFWMGPASNVHIYAGDEEPTRCAVRECFEVFGRRGFILAPSVSAHSIMPWRNTLAMVDEWRKLR